MKYLILNVVFFALNPWIYSQQIALETGNQRPHTSWILPVSISESSGVTLWNDMLWTHNDSSDALIYGFSLDQLERQETNSVLAVDQTISIARLRDWEAIAQDADYFYFGDFGNNGTGNNRNLRIAKVSKLHLDTASDHIEYINFSYPEQTDFQVQAANQTDFDCEAFIVTETGIYLFTKEWLSQQTSCYALPKTAGTYQATKIATFNIGGLVTDATYLEDKKMLALSGYSTTLSPFVYLFYGFEAHDFFSRYNRKINLNLNFHQIEGITTADGLNFFLSNERFTAYGGIISTNPKIHLLDLSTYLQPYYQTLGTRNTSKMEEGVLYPNPATDEVYLNLPAGFTNTTFEIFASNGSLVCKSIYEKRNQTIDVSDFPAGVYWLRMPGYNQKIIKK
ncbi:MAG: T9SS type A sorting domain-containing protein [Flavobacterium sp.]|nr:T9SS type A sorting domain-containing protein [Candidatus Neoflavobacterium equi]